MTTIADLFAISELVHEVVRHLKFVDRLHLAFVNKLCWQSRLFHGDHTGKFGKYQLVREQQELLARLEASTKRYKVVQAPASFGKTLIGLVSMLYSFVPRRRDDGTPAPITNEERVLLIVPPNLIRVWVEKLQEVFPNLLTNDPNTSSIIIDAPWKAKHYGFTNKNRGTILPHWKVYISSAKRTRYLEDSPNFYQNFGTMVVDEAHSAFGITYSWTEYHPLGKLLLLSANATDRLNFFLRGKLRHIEHFVIANKVIAHKIPEYEFVVMRDSVKQFLETGEYTRLVIFLPNRKLYDAYLEFVPKEIPVFKFCSALAPVTKFLASPKAILLTTYGLMKVGHNLLVDKAILVDPEVMEYEGIYQTVSRFLRISNTAERVQVMISSNNLTLVRFRFICAEMKRKYEIEHIYGSFYTKLSTGKMQRVLDHLGLDPWTIDDIEFLWIAMIGLRTIDPKIKALFEAQGLGDSTRAKELKALYRKYK